MYMSFRGLGLTGVVLPNWISDSCWYTISFGRYVVPSKLQGFGGGGAAPRNDVQKQTRYFAFDAIHVLQLQRSVSKHLNYIIQHDLLFSSILNDISVIQSKYGYRHHNSIIQIIPIHHLYCSINLKIANTQHYRLELSQAKRISSLKASVSCYISPYGGPHVPGQPSYGCMCTTKIHISVEGGKGQLWSERPAQVHCFILTYSDIWWTYDCREMPSC